MKKVLFTLAAVAALLPAAVLAHQNGPHASYDVVVQGEVLGLLAILLSAIVLFFKLRRSTHHPSALLRTGASRSTLINGLTLSLLSGVLLYLSFPPFDLGWLAWVALVPMIVAQLRYDVQRPVVSRQSSIVNRQSPNSQSPNLLGSNLQSLISRFQSPTSNFYQALTIFVTYALVFMHVFPSELPTGFPLPVWPFIVVAIAFVSVIFYVTGLPAGSMQFHRRTNFKFFISAPAFGWMGMELVRVIVEMGQSWARIPGTQHANIPLVQLSTFGGEWLVGALVIAANYALASFWRQDARRKMQDARSLDFASCILHPASYIKQHAPALIALTLILIAHVAGQSLISTPTQTVRVAAVQLGEDLGDSPDYMTYWDRADWHGMDEAVLRDFEPLVREAAARGAKIIALPEATLWEDPALTPALQARLLSLAKQTGAYITFTFYLWNDPDSRNEVYTATPQGEWLGPYAKNHPIAYIGEYSISAGKFPVYQTPYGGLSNFVCYDDTYTDVASRLASNGASILTSSNHDWPEGAWGFYTQLVYRAAENRVAIVRSDWRVGSAIIDPFGRVLASAKLGEREQTILVADVPVVLERGTVYTRTGDWFAYLGLAVLVALMLAGMPLPQRLRTALQPA